MTYGDSIHWCSFSSSLTVILLFDFIQPMQSIILINWPQIGSNFMNSRKLCFNETSLYQKHFIHTKNWFTKSLTLQIIKTTYKNSHYFVLCALIVTNFNVSPDIFITAQHSTHLELQVALPLSHGPEVSLNSHYTCSHSMVPLAGSPTSHVGLQCECSPVSSTISPPCQITPYCLLHHDSCGSYHSGTFTF